MSLCVGPMFMFPLSLWLQSPLSLEAALQMRPDQAGCLHSRRVAATDCL